MEDLEIFGVTISAWIYVPVIYFIWVTVLLIFKKIVYSIVHRVAKKTQTKFDDIILGALDLPLVLLIFVSGFIVVDRISPVGDQGELIKYLVLVFKGVTVVAIVLFLDKLSKNLIGHYSPRVEVLRSSGGIAQGVVRIVVLGLGVLILLDSFGVSITPILASLGVGSLAVALALQPTLENFFAGLQILIDKPIRVGDFVKLETGEEGYIDRIGWRSTWLRKLANNVIVIPNKVLIGQQVLNHYYPSRDMAVLVQVGVHYDSDLPKVEKITVEVGQEIMKTVEGGVPDFEPFIRYHTFGDSSINFTVILRCQEFVNNYLIKHEFVKALKARFDKEGINIPYPIRAINYAQEGATPS